MEALYGRPCYGEAQALSLNATSKATCDTAACDLSKPIAICQRPLMYMIALTPLDHKNSRQILFCTLFAIASDILSTRTLDASELSPLPCLHKIFQRFGNLRKSVRRGVYRAARTCCSQYPQRLSRVGRCLRSDNFSGLFCHP